METRTADSEENPPPCTIDGVGRKEDKRECVKDVVSIAMDTYRCFWQADVRGTP